MWEVYICLFFSSNSLNKYGYILSSKTNINKKGEFLWIDLKPELKGEGSFQNVF